MHTIMKGLKNDHKNLAKVLKIMEMQLERIAEGDDAALVLMYDSSHYIQSYPDIIHHPKEDKIFDVFKGRSSEEADALKELTQQHMDLPVTTEKFMQMLDGAINGLGFISRDELVDKIKSYIESEWKHMDLEESVIFPLIDKTLEDNDWELLEALIEADVDPLFSDKTEETFENLYQSIKDQAA